MFVGSFDPKYVSILYSMNVSHSLNGLSITGANFLAVNRVSKINSIFIGYVDSKNVRIYDQHTECSKYTTASARCSKLSSI